MISTCCMIYNRRSDPKHDAEKHNLLRMEFMNLLGNVGRRIIRNRYFIFVFLLCDFILQWLETPCDGLNSLIQLPAFQQKSIA